jgi:GT2 family glycosyltransferase
MCLEHSANFNPLIFLTWRRDVLMELSVFLEQTLFVVVLYKKKPEQSSALKAILKSTTTLASAPLVFIYDNSPQPASVTADERITYRHDAKNSGVSKAYNEAALHLRMFPHKWMLLCDQDTEFTEAAFAAYAKALSEYPKANIFTPRMIDREGIVSPFRLVLGKGLRANKITPGIHTFNYFRIINSGMLISVKAFDKANGFDERFPLDLSDIVFTDRLRQHHGEFILVDATCYHHLSGSGKYETLEEDLLRFKTYTQAVRLYSKLNHLAIPGLTIFPRSIKSSMKYRSIKFMQTGIMAMLKKV